VKKEATQIFTVLKKWGHKGIKVFPDGATLIGQIPCVSIECLSARIRYLTWFHEIYAGLTAESIGMLQDKLGKMLPNDYVDFLQCANGINVFSNSLEIFGWRVSLDRTGYETILPFDLVSANGEEFRKIPENWLYFGGYSWDGSLMLYDLSKSNSNVYRCECDSMKLLQEWPDLWTWLNTEIERLSRLFDENGDKYDNDAPTAP
jgi:hypothetical protein